MKYIRTYENFNNDNKTFNKKNLDIKKKIIIKFILENKDYLSKRINYSTFRDTDVVQTKDQHGLTTFETHDYCMFSIAEDEKEVRGAIVNDINSLITELGIEYIHNWERFLNTEKLGTLLGVSEDDILNDPEMYDIKDVNDKQEVLNKVKEYENNIKENPVEYLIELGYLQKDNGGHIQIRSFNEILYEPDNKIKKEVMGLIDLKKLIEYTASQYEFGDLSSYDGQVHKFNYNNNIYYIFMIN